MDEKDIDVGFPAAQRRTIDLCRGPPSAAQAPQPSPSEVEQSFFKNLTREHCEENSKLGSCDELLKRERQSRDDLAKDWHYYNTQRTKLPPKRWQSGGNSGMCPS